jgi:hypothetical protein
MEYDLIRLFEHPLRFRSSIPSAVVTFGSQDVGRSAIQVQWKRSAAATAFEDELMLSWDVAALRPNFKEIDEEIAILRERDEDRATRVELAAVVVAVAVMAHVEPGMRFTRRSSTGTRHDYYLNDSRTEMIEVAGRWEGGLPGLFAEKQGQSDLNSGLQKRWVSVTIILQTPRNRTEGLHP